MRVTNKFSLSGSEIKQLQTKTKKTKSRCLEVLLSLPKFTSLHKQTDIEESKAKSPLERLPCKNFQGTISLKALARELLCIVSCAVELRTAIFVHPHAMCGAPYGMPCRRRAWRQLTFHSFSAGFSSRNL